MNNVNKTLYIPLYGKAYVSQKGIILKDDKAEFIWNKEGFELKGKSQSKWLAYYMGMRSAVFDKWTLDKIINNDVIVLHIGCGMDSRCDRLNYTCEWYDIDFYEVIQERRKYYNDSDTYHMISSDIRNDDWLDLLPKDKKAIIIMEGVSMYLSFHELKELFKQLSEYFVSVNIFMDCYSVKAAKASKYKNPINDIGVTQVYGIDNPKILENNHIHYIKEHVMTPVSMINELKGMERLIFKYVFAGRFAKSLYRLYEFESCEEVYYEV